MHGNDGNAILGVSVATNTGKGTITNTSGEFVLDVGEGELFTIEFSMMGYKTRIIEGKCDTLSDVLNVYLEKEQKGLKEITIEASQTRRSTFGQSISIELIDEEFLLENKSQGLVQTLSNLPGIQSLNIGNASAKPMIRGLGFYRVIAANNGIPHVGQSWSRHHGLLISESSTSHIEVIKGPASLEYGSGAIGGVINILPHHIPLAAGTEGEIEFTANSNNRGAAGSAELINRTGDVYLILNTSLGRYQDFRIPKTDSFYLPVPATSVDASHKVLLGDNIVNTAAESKSANMVLGIVKPKWNGSLEFSVNNNNSGFFDWEGLRNNEVRTQHNKSQCDILLPRQDNVHYNLNNYLKRYFLHGKLESWLGIQQNNTKEFSIYKQDPELFLKLTTITQKLTFQSKRLHNQEFKIGETVQLQQHNDLGWGHILPNYNQQMLGAFLNYNYAPNKKINIEAGARGDNIRMRIDSAYSPLNDFILYNPIISREYPGFSFNIGVKYRTKKLDDFTFNIGRTYRYPSVYELAAYGLHRHEGRFEKGDVANNNEVAWQFDFGYRINRKYLSVNLSPYLNYFTNYLYLLPTATLRKEGQVYKYQQTEAIYTGGEFYLDIKAIKNISCQLLGEYVYAVNITEKSALPFTPPMDVSAIITYKMPDAKGLFNNKLALEVNHVAAQKYTVPNELSTPAYTLLNLKGRTSFNFFKYNAEVWCNVHNLLNVKYFNHLSFYRRLRIPEPGRNILLTLKITL